MKHSAFESEQQRYSFIYTRLGQLDIRVSLDNSFLKNADSLSNLNMENHCHSVYEVHFVLKGTFLVEVEGTAHRIGSGYYYFIPPGVYHEQMADLTSPANKLSFRFEYEVSNEPDTTQTRQKEPELASALSCASFFILHDKKQLASLLSEIQEELKNHHPGYHSKVSSLFSIILVEILRNCSVSAKPAHPVTSRAIAENRYLMIEDFFENNYNESVASLCALLYVSARQLNRILRETIGMSFKQKALERRMEIAKNMLKYSDSSINKVAERVGYDSLSNFSAIFKKKTGMSPVAFREMVRNRDASGL